MALEDVVRGNGGYRPPPGVSEQILAILREDPHLTAQYLHDAGTNTEAGLQTDLSKKQVAEADALNLVNGNGVAQPYSSDRIQQGFPNKGSSNVQAPGRNIHSSWPQSPQNAKGGGSSAAAHGTLPNPYFLNGEASSSRGHLAGHSAGNGVDAGAGTTSASWERPTYAQMLNGVNPLFEEIQPRPKLSSISGVKNSFGSLLGPNLSASYLGGLMERGKEPEATTQPSVPNEIPHETPTPAAKDQSSLSHEKQGHVFYNVADLDSWQSKLESKALVGSCFGPRPSVEQVRSWMQLNWGNKGIKVPHVQYLPNGYFLFMFEDPLQAPFVLGQDT